MLQLQITSNILFFWNIFLYSNLIWLVFYFYRVYKSNYGPSKAPVKSNGPSSNNPSSLTNSDDSSEDSWWTRIKKMLSVIFLLSFTGIFLYGNGYFGESAAINPRYVAWNEFAKLPDYIRANVLMEYSLKDYIDNLHTPGVEEMSEAIQEERIRNSRVSSRIEYWSNLYTHLEKKQILDDKEIELYRYLEHLIGKSGEIVAARGISFEEATLFVWKLELEEVVEVAREINTAYSSSSEWWFFFRKTSPPILFAYFFIYWLTN